MFIMAVLKFFTSCYGLNADTNDNLSENNPYQKKSLRKEILCREMCVIHLTRKENMCFELYSFPDYSGLVACSCSVCKFCS